MNGKTKNRMFRNFRKNHGNVDVDFIELLGKFERVSCSTNDVFHLIRALFCSVFVGL